MSQKPIRVARADRSAEATTANSSPPGEAAQGAEQMTAAASYATAKALGIDPDPATGGVDSGVTDIVFPGAVPSPVESNSAIDSKGISAANAFVNS